MSSKNFNFDAPPHRTNIIRILKWEFPLPDRGSVLSLSSKDETKGSAFGGTFSRILQSSHSGIYALLILMMSMFLFSCEDQPMNVENDQITLQENNGLSQMTDADKLKYFGTSDLSQLKPGYTYHLDGYTECRRTDADPT